MKKIQGLFKYYKKFNLKNIGIKKIGNLAILYQKLTLKNLRVHQLYVFHTILIKVHEYWHSNHRKLHTILWLY